MTHHLKSRLSSKIIGDRMASLGEIKASAKDRQYLSSHAVDYVGGEQLDKNQETRQTLHREALGQERQAELQQ